MPTDWTRFGPLADRYNNDRPRRILALDGGGIRGLLTLVALHELERKLAAAYSDARDFRLCHFFDYIGGTSTGAIIAAALARGLSVRELLDFYEKFGEIAFKRTPLWKRWKTFYGDSELTAKLKDVLGKDTTLVPGDLETLLLIVTRNKSTDSAWPLSSNPLAKYNDPARVDCNLKLPLWQLVRASTAAPVYFPPEEFSLGPRVFLFVDGGTTPYNNPAFLMTRMATEPAYRLSWPAGEDRLLVVSFGTGYRPNAVDAERDDANILESATNTLQSLMTQAAYDQDVNCRTVGRCVHGHVLERELSDLIPRDENGVPLPLAHDLGRRFLYTRYDIDIAQEALDGNPALAGIKSDAIAKLDATDSMAALKRVGTELAKRIDLAHLGPFIGTPLFRKG